MEITDHAKLDPWPIPVPPLREGYAPDNHGWYWTTGLLDYLKVNEAIEIHGLQTDGQPRVLDFGCSSGRYLRHVASHEADVEIWGTDFDLDNVNWVRDNLPPVRALLNTVVPHLPFEDSSFDVITAFSVFTHIDSFELEWLSELKRILCHGGLAYLSVQSERTWKRIPQRDYILKKLVSAQKLNPDFKIAKTLFEEPMPRDRVVFRWSPKGAYAVDMYHSQEYLRRVWNRHMEVLDIYDAALSDLQDVVVLRKG